MIINKNMTLNSLIENKNILAIYPHGSQIYETLKDKSDLDYIVIIENDYNIEEQVSLYDETIKRNLDFNFYTEKKWIEMCDLNHIDALESMSVIQHNLAIKNNKQFEVIIDKIKLRRSISSVVSNAWSKAHKKLTVDEDYSPYIAKKSLWHCFRILMFGIQIYKFGKIVDLTEANSLYDEIVNCEINDWIFYKIKYQPKLNKLKTEFKKYSEKEWINFKNS